MALGKKTSSKKGIVRYYLIHCIILTFALTVMGATVPLLWDKSTDTRVNGYKIYIGTNSHNYYSFYNAGQTNVFCVSNLIDNLTYFFAATSYDTNGTESDFSNEAIYPIGNFKNEPLINPTYYVNTNTLKKEFRFQMTNSFGVLIVVQATTNLLGKWENISTNRTPFTFIDTNAFKYSNRFYRTIKSP